MGLIKSKNRYLMADNIQNRHILSHISKNIHKPWLKFPDTNLVCFALVFNKGVMSLLKRLLTQSVYGMSCFIISDGLESGSVISLQYIYLWVLPQSSKGCHWNNDLFYLWAFGCRVGGYKRFSGDRHALTLHLTECCLEVHRSFP